MIDKNSKEVKDKTKESLARMLRANLGLLVAVAAVSICCSVCLCVCCYRTIKKRDIARADLSVYSVSDEGSQRSRASFLGRTMSKIFGSFANIRRRGTVSRQSLTAS